MIVPLSDGRDLPVEMYKVRMVQKTSLPPIGQRLSAVEEAGYNTFLLWTKDVFIDMLTDSGTNAMSDNQLAAMMASEDFEMGGARVLEFFHDDAMETSSDNPFKGNIDLKKLKAVIDEYGAENAPFVRMEATRNLIGGQPFSIANQRGFGHPSFGFTLPFGCGQAKSGRVRVFGCKMRARCAHLVERNSFRCPFRTE